MLKGDIVETTGYGRRKIEKSRQKSEIAAHLPLSSESAGELDVLWLNGDSLGVDGLVLYA